VNRHNDAAITHGFTSQSALFALSLMSSTLSGSNSQQRCNTSDEMRDRSTAGIPTKESETYIQYIESESVYMRVCVCVGGGGVRETERN
jgi:hypothetical protein